MLRLTYALECPVCKQNFNGEKQTTTAQIAIIFGAVKYSICCNCIQEVDIETIKNHWYRKRWDKKMQKEMGKDNGNKD